MPPGPLQRGLLVLLQAVAPYLAERISAPQDEGFAAWQAARWQHEAHEGAVDAGGGGGWRVVTRRLGGRTGWLDMDCGAAVHDLIPGISLAGWIAPACVQSILQHMNIQHRFSLAHSVALLPRRRMEPGNAGTRTACTAARLTRLACRHSALSHRECWHAAAPTPRALLCVGYLLPASQACGR